MTTWNFPTTGNAEQDETEAARIRRSMELRERGLCPNDEAVMEQTEPHMSTCPVCGFVEVRSTISAGNLTE